MNMRMAENAGRFIRPYLGVEVQVEVAAFGQGGQHGGGQELALLVVGEPVGPGHVVASSYVENRREWAIRRECTGSPLGGPARGLVAAELARLRRLFGEQPPLW